MPAAPPEFSTGMGRERGAESFVEDFGRDSGAFEVVAGRSRLLSVAEDLRVPGMPEASVTIGDPLIVEAEVAGPRQVRVTGLRFGATDLAITAAGGMTVDVEVRVVADLGLLQARLRELFPDATPRLAQIQDNVFVVEGQARDAPQVARIIEVVRGFVESIPDRRRSEPAPKLEASIFLNQPAPSTPGPVPIPAPTNNIPLALLPLTNVIDELENEGSIADPKIINLLRVPGPQQVLLKVRIAELNREALREVGANILGVDPDSGAIFGTQTGTRTGRRGAGPGNVNAVGTIEDRGLLGQATGVTNEATTAFGIFEAADIEILLRALRRNSVLKILAEPNLVALNGHLASFLAGGEFPIPVPQVSGGAAAAITVAFKEFGVRLGFVPYILDGDVIRLTVAPEVSEIDFSFATTLVQNGQPIPGLVSRKSQTTVELREGQTLAIAGLLQLRLDAETSRIPGLGDLPILGPFFSNTTDRRVEKELVVLVTPYLVMPMDPGQVPPTPGDEVLEPNDLEFYLLNRIEGRTGKDFRATTKWDDPYRILDLLRLEERYVRGPSGFSN